MTPDKSEASISKGIWFVLEDGTNIIKILGSNITCQEKIYLNGKVVSECRSLRLRNSHRFEDNDGAVYEVHFETTNLLKGEMVCYVVKNGNLIRQFSTKYQRDPISTNKDLITIIVASAFFGGLIGFFNLSVKSLLVFLVLVLVIVFKSRTPGKFVIEELKD